MSRRLLLVDDEDTIREIAQLSLERVGDWEVIATASGQEAIEAAQREGPVDVVLLDVMMPGLDGPSTMRALRADSLGYEVPFVFLTAKLQAADRERLTEIGAAGVIAKPFDPMSLADELDRIIVGADRSASRDGERVYPDFAELWSRKRATIEARAATIATAVAASARGEPEPEQHAAAVTAAHMLGGLLGTFGLHRGSELARSLESGLEASEPAHRLQALSAELAELIAGTEAESRTISSGSTQRDSVKRDQ